MDGACLSRIAKELKQRTPGASSLGIQKTYPFELYWKVVVEPTSPITMYRARRVVIESHKPLVVEADGGIPYLETHHLKAKILPKNRVVRAFSFSAQASGSAEGGS